MSVGTSGATRVSRKLGAGPMPFSLGHSALTCYIYHDSIQAVFGRRESLAEQDGLKTTGTVHTTHGGCLTKTQRKEQHF